MARDVFVSHASEDRALAARLAVFLEACGIACFLAPRDIPAGTVWDEAVVDGIDHCAGMVLVLSTRANASPFVKNEINRAFSKNKPLFAFRTEEVALGKSLELYLARHQWIDGFPGPAEEKFAPLAEAIGAWLKRPVHAAVLAAARGRVSVPTGGAPSPITRRPGVVARALAGVRAWRFTRERLLMLVSAVSTVALVTVVGMQLLSRPSSADPPEIRTEIVTPGTSDPISFALSPDGKQIVFVASGDGPSRLWLRPLAATSAQPLAGTEGATTPFWSPDSRSVAFFADAKLKRLDLVGGTPQTLVTRAFGRGGTWNAGGVILFSRDAISPIFRVVATGGEPVAVTKLGPQTSHRWPTFFPDGQHFLFYAQGPPDTAGIYLGVLDGGDPIRLTAADTGGLYVPSGWLLWVRAGTLVAQRLDLTRRAMVGESVTVAAPVVFDAGKQSGAASVSTTGLVAYRSGEGTRRQLTWIDRGGQAMSTLGMPDDNNLLYPRMSPDGRRVVVARTVQGNQDLWLLDGARTTRFTFDTAPDRLPVWSPDGGRIAFQSTRKGLLNLYVKSSSGGGNEELLVDSAEDKTANDWSPDGRFLLYHSITSRGDRDLWVLPLEGDRKPWVFLKTAFDERNGQFSPNGRWVAYMSNESGRMEIYVRPFVTSPSSTSHDGAAGDRAGPQWQVSTAGGISPRWRPDGKELYYLGPDGQMMAAPIAATGTTITPGTPVALFRTNIYGRGLETGQGRQYDVARDGRFLINTVVDDAAAPITLLQNWRPDSKK